MKLNRTTLIPAAAFLALCLPLFASADDSFVPLTSLPGIGGLTGAPSLPVFLNSLYRLIIGVAAAAAMIRFIMAGYIFMTSSGSVASNKKAREMIQNTVFGLVLVLSPYLVFSVINPQILKLDLNFGALKNTSTSGSATPSGDTGTGGGAASTGATGCDAYTDTGVAPSSGSCTAVGPGFKAVAAECCSPSPAAGYTCCGTTDASAADNGIGQGPAASSDSGNKVSVFGLSYSQTQGSTCTLHTDYYDSNAKCNSDQTDTEGQSGFKILNACHPANEISLNGSSIKRTTLGPC
jgi:hypothetical protein